MIGWIILGVIVLLLFWLLMTRAGAHIQFGEDGFTVRLVVGWFSYQLWPGKPKKKGEAMDAASAPPEPSIAAVQTALEEQAGEPPSLQPEAVQPEAKLPEVNQINTQDEPPKAEGNPPTETVTAAAPENAANKEKQPKKSGKNTSEPQKTSSFLDKFEVKKLIKVGLHAIDRFRKKLRFDILELHILAASDEPDKTTVLYGRICSALGAALPFLHHYFRIRRQSITTSFSFDQEKMKAKGQVKVTIRIGSVVGLGLWGLLQVLKCRKVTPKTKKSSK